MTALERFLGTLRGEPVDRPVVLAVLSAYGAKLTGADLPAHYSDPALYVQGQQAVHESFQLDALLAPFDLSAVGEAFGGAVAYGADQPPNLARPAAETAAAALDLSLPNPQTAGRLPYILEASRRLADQFGQRVPVFAVVPGPCALPALVMGLETWLETLLFDEATAAEVLRRTTSFWSSWTQSLFATGATGLLVAEGMASSEVLPRGLFRSTCLPTLERAFTGVKGPLLLHHTGGHLNPVVDLIPALPNVLGVAVSSKDDLTESRRLLGPQSLLVGNLDNLSLPALTAQQVFAQSLKCLRVGVSGGPFALCNSGGDVPLNTPAENLHAMRRAAEAHAREAGP